MVSRLIVVASTLFALSSASCSDSTNCPAEELACRIATVSVSPSSVVLNSPSQVIVLQVVALDAAGDTVDIDTIPRVWSSSQPSIASVNANGLVTAIAQGTSIVSVSSPILPDSSRSAEIVVDFSAVPTQLGVATHPGAGVLGGALNPQPVVHFRNAQGQLVSSNQQVTVSKASGPGVLGGTTTVQATGGIAQFTNLSISNATGVHQLRFTATGLPEVQSATFAVTDPPSSSVIHFRSDWSTALGYSANAVTDGGRWPTLRWWSGTGTPPANGRVVTIASEGLLGFPAGLQNVLKVSYAGFPYPNPNGSPGDILIQEVDNKWPVPAVGQTFFHRFYLLNALRNSATGGAGAGNHPFQGFGDDPTTGSHCTFNWEYKFGSNSNGTFAFNMSFLRNSNTTPQGQWNLNGLAKFQAHLIEVGYTKVATNTYTVRARVNGVDRTADFLGGPNANLRLTDFATHNISDFCLRTLFLGNNDPGGTFPNADHTLDFAYWGAVAVAVRSNANDWIGPWVP